MRINPDTLPIALRAARANKSPSGVHAPTRTKFNLISIVEQGMNAQQKGSDSVELSKQFQQRKSDLAARVSELTEGKLSSAEDFFKGSGVFCEFNLPNSVFTMLPGLPDDFDPSGSTVIRSEYSPFIGSLARCATSDISFDVPENYGLQPYETEASEASKSKSLPDYADAEKSRGLLARLTEMLRSFKEKSKETL